MNLFQYPGRDGHNSGPGVSPVCIECGRGFNNEAEVAKYYARQKERVEETARAIQQAAEQARNEERAKNEANEDATIKELTARLAQKDEECDEVIRKQAASPPSS